MAFVSGSVGKRELGQKHLVLVSAACERVGYVLANVRTAATGTFVFAGATGELVRIFLQVRTFSQLSFTVSPALNL